MRKKTIIFGSLVILAIAFVGAYIYVPKYFGDTVYPLQYSSIIQKYANEYDVDPALIAAVILQESRFNPNAVSAKGAKGLMQIMPATAAGIAGNLGVKNYDLRNPETSIWFGTWYLKQKLNHYNNDIDATLAAYNAGSGNADRWIRLGILDRIPFNETNNYVRKVKNYMTVYKTMYAEELGLAKTPVELRETTKEEEEAKVRGLIWTKIFDSILSFSW